mmetsp:Transcript_26036/g.57640  ORF Transcript_26036/g.57640 Transcript_26036/m.57640 type:complete len:374 (+) Transcript_26036:951-2072(+)
MHSTQIAPSLPGTASTASPLCCRYSPTFSFSVLCTCPCSCSPCSCCPTALLLCRPRPVMSMKPTTGSTGSTISSTFCSASDTYSPCRSNTHCPCVSVAIERTSFVCRNISSAALAASWRTCPCSIFSCFRRIIPCAEPTASSSSSPRTCISCSQRCFSCSLAFAMMCCFCSEVRSGRMWPKLPTMSMSFASTCEKSKFSSTSRDASSAFCALCCMESRCTRLARPLSALCCSSTSAAMLGTSAGGSSPRQWPQWKRDSLSPRPLYTFHCRDKQGRQTACRQGSTTARVLLSASSPQEIMQDAQRSSARPALSARTPSQGKARTSQDWTSWSPCITPSSASLEPPSAALDLAFVRSLLLARRRLICLADAPPLL